MSQVTIIKEPVTN